MLIEPLKNEVAYGIQDLVNRTGVRASYRLLGVRVDDIAPQHLIERIAASIRLKRKMMVVNANANLINLSVQHPWLVELFNRADIAFCDGAGVQIALWLQTGKRPHRHTPPQWINALGKRLAADGASVFWLGGRPESVEMAARNLEFTTGARAAGWHHGFFNLNHDSQECGRVVAAINRTGADVILVNLGMPLQERWLAENWDRLDASVGITGGALVDHVSGQVRRPPLWVADLGLEWLVRLAIEPQRLWRRYLFGLPIFGFRLLVSLLWSALSRITK